jgi:hypothetical protein
MCCPSKGMHNTSYTELCCWIYRSSRNIQERSTRADQHQTCVFLLRRLFRSILLDEIVECKFGTVECSFEVDIDCFQIWFFGFLIFPSQFRQLTNIAWCKELQTFKGKNLIVRTDTGVSYDKVDLAGKRCSFSEHASLILPVRDVTFHKLCTSEVLA